LPRNNQEEVILYSDGSSLGNPGPGGYGGILEYKGVRKEFSGGEPHTTNNRMELKAVIEGLRMLKKPCRVHVITASSYVSNAINDWLEKWIAKDFKKVKNVDLWQEYVKKASPHKIRASWIRGHSGHPENELCDKLARKEAARQQDIVRKKESTYV
jgi:ribonuclease HI